MQDDALMKLPPLNAIKAFEATARLGGFTVAAIELGVSPTAVSLQVRKAETFLGKQLFLRSNNKVSLTDAGHMLYPQVAKSLEGLAMITEQFLENEARSRLVISTVQSLAEKCVVPAVARLRKACPNVGISVLIENDPVDFVRQRIDLRLTYGNLHYPEMQSVLAFHDSVAPVCSAEFARRHESDLQKIHDEDLIHIDWGEAFASYPTWGTWFRKTNVPRFPDVQKGLRVAGTGVAISLAAQGAGIALAPLRLSVSHLKSGKLVQLGTKSVQMPYGYFAIMAPLNSQNRRQARTAQYINRLLQDFEFTH